MNDDDGSTKFLKRSRVENRRNAVPYSPDRNTQRRNPSRVIDRAMRAARWVHALGPTQEEIAVSLVILDLIAAKPRTTAELAKIGGEGMTMRLAAMVAAEVLHTDGYQFLAFTREGRELWMGVRSLIG